jgi:hypothetical protein
VHAVGGGPGEGTAEDGGGDTEGGGGEMAMGMLEGVLDALVIPFRNRTLLTVGWCGWLRVG